jgi:hypothetical protein
MAARLLAAPSARKITPMAPYTQLQVSERNLEKLAQYGNRQNMLSAKLL